MWCLRNNYTFAASLGDVRRRDYDKIVLGYLGYGASKMELKPIADGQQIEPPKDIAQDILLELGTGGILFGDPALIPFKSNSNGAPVFVKVAHDEINKTLTVAAEISLEHLGYFCSEPTASWDGRAGGAMKVYTKVPLPADYVSNVAIQRIEMGNLALKSRLVWAVESDRGQRFIHLKSIFPRPEAFLGAEAWNGLGWARLKTGKAQAAEHAFQKVLSLNSDHPAALNGLGQSTWRRRNTTRPRLICLKRAHGRRPPGRGWRGSTCSRENSRRLKNGR